MSNHVLDAIGMRRGVVLLLSVLVPLVGSYGLVFAWRQHSERRRLQTSIESPKFPNGTYLVAYVLMSSKCHFCTDAKTKAAIRKLRSTLNASSRGRYANISVVGVALDRDMAGELGYLAGLGKSGEVFDEISAGGGWLNQLVTDVVWRDGFGAPEVPQGGLVKKCVNEQLGGVAVSSG